MPNIGLRAIMAQTGGLSSSLENFEAREFARTRKIELLDGSALAELIGSNRG